MFNIKILLRLTCCLLLAIPSGVFAEKDLKFANIRQTMHTIFNYHVENKDFSPLIVKRSFKIYLELFDSDKFYLLKEEVSPFLDLKDKEIDTIIKHYEKDRFEHYVLLNALIEKAIIRHRKIREEVRQEILAGVSFEYKEGDNPSDYPATEGEIKRKIAVKLCKWIEAKQKRASEPFSIEKKVKLLALQEKKFRRMEGYYDSFEQKTEVIEHYQCMHILKCITKSLDSHSAYYSPEEAAELRAALKKQFYGIGVVFKENEDGIFVADLVTGGPAHQTKAIVVGDYVVAVDGYNIQESSFDEVLERLRGEEGKSIELTLKTVAGEEKKVSLKREKIMMNEERLSFTYEPYADGVIGKIVLPGFYDNGEGINSEKDLREALKELKNLGPLYGLVIDLRENSGGFLTQAVKVAGLFITKGVIVISKYSDGEIRYMRDLEGKCSYQGPIVLLTSKASASAAEIVAQALQDYGVALIVGDERTYGKGSMQYQTVTEDDAKAFFKVTVGRYYTISGRSTQIEGVKADIHVPTMFSPYNIGERYLEYPLSSDRLDWAQIYNEKSSNNKHFQKKQIPELKAKQTEWTHMIPALKANSEKRMNQDPNFQLFFKKLKGEPILNSEGRGLSIDFMQMDLQTKEAVNIVKDMIYLSQSASQRV